MLKLVQNHFKILITVLFSISLLLYASLATPQRTGDGWEYMLMSVSFAKHHSFDLQKEDMKYAYDNIAIKNNLQGEFLTIYNPNKTPGFYEALNKKLYCYHFWFYSLIASLFIPIFSSLKLNLLSIFQFTNALFIILLMFWINYRANLSQREKTWLNFITLLGPMWLYLKWTHPEIFIFTFVYISLLEYRDNNKISACLFAALASLQNSVLIIFPAFMILEEIISKKKIDKKVLLMFLASSILLIPEIFYYYNYKVFSLLTTVAVDYSLISTHRALDLFFDLNFGLLLFIPLILLLAIFLCFKKNKICLKLSLLILLMAYICSAQMNWNSGMQFVNRYSFWMIPFLFMGTLDYFSNIDKNKFKKMLIGFFITTTIPLFIYRIINYDYGQFSPIAKIVLSLKPSLYNPEYETFSERVTHLETEPSYPVVYENKLSGTKKLLVKDEKTGLKGYLNKDKIKINYKIFNKENILKNFKIKIKYKQKKCEIKINSIKCTKRD